MGRLQVLKMTAHTCAGNDVSGQAMTACSERILKVEENWTGLAVRDGQQG